MQPSEVERAAVMVVTGKDSRGRIRQLSERRFFLRCSIIAAPAILADVIAEKLRTSEQLRYEAVLTVIVVGALISANDNIWNAKWFWPMSVVFAAGLLAIWFVLNTLLSPFGFLLIAAISIGGLWLFDQLLGLIR